MNTPQSSVFLALSLLTPAVTAQSQISGRTDDRAVAGTYPLAEIEAYLADPANHEPFVPQAPLGLPEDLSPFVPEGDPLTPAKVDLGRQLYFDKRLSRDGAVSCATCHDPAMGWTDNEPVSTGIDGQKGGRSAPTVVNRLLGQTQFWDGRAPTLEAQAVGPIENPIEMGFTHDEVVERLNGIPGYRIQFEEVYGGVATIDFVGRAIAAFERTILSGANQNDYYEQALPWFDWLPEEEEDPVWRQRGLEILTLEKTHRMSDAAWRGRELFFDKGSCSQCHVGADLTDELFHDIGVGVVDGELTDEGRSKITGDEADRGGFKTPSLRNIALTAPYMHDGSMATLMEVVEHYDQGGIPHPSQSDKIFPLKLTEQEKQDLVRFLEEALTGPTTEVEVPRLPADASAPAGIR